MIVLAAAGMWMTLLAIIGLAVIAETMNILHPVHVSLHILVHIFSTFWSKK